MKLQELLNKRYTVKKFDTEKKLTEEELEGIKSLLQLSPSSVNIQPWHFTIATSQEGIKKIAKSTAEFGFNDEKIRDASALVVFSQVEMTDEYLKDIIEKEDKDGRYANEELKNSTDGGRRYFYGMHEDTLNDADSWLRNQVYLNVGYFTLGAALLHLDTVIMEGFDPEIVKSELNLKNQTPVVIVGVGKGADDDYNKVLPKSRLDADMIIDIV